MSRKHLLVLVTLLVGVGLLASTAVAQSTKSDSSMRFGVGTSMARVNDGAVLGKTTFVPTANLDFGKADAEFGFYPRSGEDETQFILQLGGAYYPFIYGYGSIGFGLQFYLETDAVVVQGKGQSAFMFGIYAEYKVSATDNLDLGLRIFPFQLFHSDSYDRVGVFAPGLAVAFFF